jgi:hypothetical protein
MLGKARQKAAGAVGVNHFFANVQRRSFHGNAVIVFHDALHQVFGDGERLWLRGFIMPLKRYRYVLAPKE